jgi:hypothetical protein
VQAQPDVRKEEIDDSGLTEWLQTKGNARVTKQEVLDFVQERQSPVRETVHGAKVIKGEEGKIRYRAILNNINYGTYDTREEADAQLVASLKSEFIEGESYSVERLRAGLWGVFVEGEGDKVLGEFPTEEAAKRGMDRIIEEEARKVAREQGEILETRGDEDLGDTRYGSYVLPGGKNYRETLLTLPESNERGRWSNFDEWLTERVGSRELTEQERAEFKREWDQLNPAAGTFRSAHFTEPNILTHLRTTERVDADGKKMLFVEEIQSDWHQQGREKGYSKGETQKDEFGILTAEYGGWLQRNNLPQLSAEDLLAEHGRSMTPDQRTYVNNFIQRWDAIERRTDFRVPNAPFKKSWPMLAMKNAIKQAIDGGFERVGWTTGQQQADRYGLGDDRGEGMKAFYDRELVNETNRYIKKWGGKVTTTTISVESRLREGEAVGDISNQPIHAFDITPQMREAFAGKPQPRYSRAPIQGKASKLATTFNLLARQQGIFRHAKQDSQSFEKIAAGIDPTLRVSQVSLGDHFLLGSGDRKGAALRFGWQVAFPNQEPVYVIGDLRDKTVHIDASRLRQGMGGSAIYALVSNWARNNNYRFIADPAGLSNEAIRRRPEHIISSILKYGSSDYVGPDEDHLRAWDEKRRGKDFFWPGMKWKAGDTAYNLDQALQATYNLVRHYVPEIENVVYDPAREDFIDRRTGETYSRRRFGSLAESPAARAANAGPTTLARAAVANTVLSGHLDEAGWRVFLGELVKRQDQPTPTALEGILYSRATPAARSPADGATELQISLRQAVSNAVASLLEGYQNVPEIIVKTTAQLTQAERRLLGNIQGAEGAFLADENRLYVFTDNVTSPERAAWVTAHELFGHYGLRGVLGDRLDETLETISDNPQIKKLAEAIVAERLAYGEVLDHLGATEEALAELAAADATGNWEQLGAQYGIPVTKFRQRTLKQALQRFVARLLAKLRSILGQPAAAFTEADVINLVRDARRHVRRPTPQPRQGATTAPAYSRRAGGGSTTAFAAENARLREEDKTAWDGASRFWRRQFFPGGLLPKEAFDIKIWRDNQFAVVEFDVQVLDRSLEKAIKVDYRKAPEKLTRLQQTLLSRALGGNVDPRIPQRTRTALVAMRQYLSALSNQYSQLLQNEINQLMAAGATAEAQAKADLLATIQANIDTYVHRSYRAFDDPKWFKSVPRRVVNDALTYFINRYQGQGQTPTQARVSAERTVNSILKEGTAYESLSGFIKESKLGAKDLSILKHRQDIAPEIRALLGEHVDPRLNFAKSATKIGRLIWNQHFLDKVRQVGLGVFLFEEGTQPPAATKKIAADLSEVYSPLNGLYTYPDVNQAFQDSLGKENMEAWYRTIVQLNGAVKYGKTVLAPTTAARNWQSAMFFALANGHFNMRHITKSLGSLKAYFTKGGRPAKLAYLRRLKELGVVYDTPYAGEMMRLLEDSKIEQILEGSSSKMADWFNFLNNYAVKAYQFGDDFWKIIGFENEKSALERSGMTPAQAEVEAAARIRNTYPTYSLVGRGIRSLARFPLAGTFVAFPSEIIRTTSHIARYIYKDYRGGRKALSAQRAVGAAFVSAFFASIEAISKAMLGMDDEEEEAVRELAAPWQKSANLWFVGRTDEGMLRYFDMSFLDPYNYFKRPITAAMRGRPLDETMFGVTVEAFKPFFGPDITAGALFEVFANKKISSGTPIYDEHEGVWDISKKIANHLRQAVQPGIVGNVERTALAAMDRYKKSGQPYSGFDEGLAWIGWRPTTLDPLKALQYRAYDFNDAKSGASSKLNRAVTDPNELSDDALSDVYTAASDQRAEAYRKLQLVVNAARQVGATDEQLMIVLKSVDVPQKDLAVLIANEPLPPMAVQAQSAKRLQRRVSADRQPETERRLRKINEGLVPATQPR